MQVPPSPYNKAFSEESGSFQVFRGSSPITMSSLSSKAHQKSGSFPPPALPSFVGRTTLSDSRSVRRQMRRWSCELQPKRASPDYPCHPSSVPCHIPRRTERVRRLLPRSRGLPRYSGGSASASSLSRPAQALLALRPAGLLNRPRRPLSRGFNPVGRPTKLLVSYQINRQLSGWNLPPLVLRAFGAH